MTTEWEDGGWYPGAIGLHSLLGVVGDINGDGIFLLGIGEQLGEVVPALYITCIAILI